MHLNNRMHLTTQMASILEILLNNTTHVYILPLGVFPPRMYSLFLGQAIGRIPIHLLLEQFIDPFLCKNTILCQGGREAGRVRSTMASGKIWAHAPSQTPRRTCCSMRPSTARPPARALTTMSIDVHDARGPRQPLHDDGLALDLLEVVLGVIPPRLQGLEGGRPIGLGRQLRRALRCSAGGSADARRSEEGTGRHGVSTLREEGTGNSY